MLKIKIHGFFFSLVSTNERLKSTNKFFPTNLSTV